MVGIYNRTRFRTPEKYYGRRNVQPRKENVPARNVQEKASQDQSRDAKSSPVEHRSSAEPQFDPRRVSQVGSTFTGFSARGNQVDIFVAKYLCAN